MLTANLSRTKTICFAQVLLGLAILSVHLVAQSPGKFVAIGSMTTSRGFHTATLLNDGRVLITGGYQENHLGATTFLASAELYDPSTGTFTPTGDMTTPRQWHSATLLTDGRVLIAGGYSRTNLRSGSSSELYDPATGIFTRSGDMSGQHSLHSAILLGSGKVLITGSPVGELYDPASGAFTVLGPANDQGNNSVALLRNGLLLVAGDGVSLYNVTRDSLTLVAKLPGYYAYQTTTVLANGKVLIAGGGVSDSFDATLNEASLYDPHSGSLQGTGLLLFSREGHTATLLPDRHVLIVGGYDGDAYDTGIPALTDAEDYDPSTGTFTSAGSLVHIRNYSTATLLPDGTVLITGGSAANLAAELYIPPLRATSAASLSGPLTPDSLASLFGSRLTTVTESADSLSPPTSLGGISLRLVDSSGTTRLAPLLYVSPSQVTFVVPARTAPGKVTIEVLNATALPAQTTAEIDNIDPALFAYDDNTAIAYALRIEPDGKQTVLYIHNTIVLDDRPVYLVFYATGIRNRSSVANVQCTIGGISVPVEYAGPEGSGIPGLDQVNVRLPSDLQGLGLANLALTVDGIPSNTVSVEIR